MKESKWEKMLDYFGLGRYEDNDGEDIRPAVSEPFPGTVVKRGKVLDIRTASQVRVVIFQPTSFDQTSEICDNLKNRKPVIVNMENIDGDLAQRIMDFLSGAVYAVDGSLHKISGGIVLAAPSNVEITENLREELKDKMFFKWPK
jgi:cell division inhibitor SepF